MWLNDQVNANATKLGEIRPFTYIRIVGQIRSFQNLRNIVAYRVLPIHDSNEMTFHLLEAVRVHLINTRGPLPTQGQPAAIPRGFANAPAHAPVHGAPAYAPYGGDQNVGSRSSRDQVFAWVKANRHTKQGVAVDAIARALNRPLNEIRQEIDYLITEGHLYSTTDDNYVAPTATY